MNWAEAVLPDLFIDHQDTVTVAGYVYRRYPKSNSFIAVSNDGVVYVLLAGVSDQARFVGTLDSFKCTLTGQCGAISLLAGSIGGPGFVDGPVAVARFEQPASVAVGPDGSVYVTDYATLRKIAPDGTVVTLAGTPGAFPSIAAPVLDPTKTFVAPSGLAFDRAGNLYVADATSVRKITPEGSMSVLAGLPGAWGTVDGQGSAARFVQAAYLTVDDAGTVYVSDSQQSVIRKITPSGLVSTLAGSPAVWGSTDGQGSAASFRVPSGIAVDGNGNVFVAEAGSACIRKITPSGLVSTFAGSKNKPGSVDGAGLAAGFGSPAGLAMDSAGNLWVSDFNDNVIRKVSPTGQVTTVAGKAGQGDWINGTGADARFWWPSDLTVDASGNIFVADQRNAAVRKITPAGVVSTLAGSGVANAWADGQGGAAQFNTPVGVALDKAGNAYVADSESAVIRKITPAGAVTTLAGIAGVYGSADGLGASARFARPVGVAVDSAGNVYVTDQATSLPAHPEKPDGPEAAQSRLAPTRRTRIFHETPANTIRKITPQGMVSTLAGVAAGFSLGVVDGQGSAARFYRPGGIAVDAAGILYVADGLAVRKVTPAGMVSTLAGELSYSGNASPVDGTGLSARFYSAVGVAVDNAGFIYVADSNYYYDSTVRKITPAGVVSTLAGAAGSTNITNTVDGVGTAARFGQLATAIAVDGAGNVYVGDSTDGIVAAGNSVPMGTIRKVTPSGVVTTVAGTSTKNLLGTALGPLPGNLSSVGGIAMDAQGALVITSVQAVLKIQLP